MYTQYQQNPEEISRNLQSFPNTSVRYDPGQDQSGYGWPMYRTPAVPHSIARMDRGRVWGEHGTVVSPDNKLVWDMSQEPCPPPQHSIFQRTELPLPTYLPETVGVATDYSAANYYFWMTDVLAKIELWRTKGVQVEKYVINRRVRPFQTETLKTLGIPEERLIECHSDLHLQARRLILTPSVAYTGQTASWICELLRTRLGPAPSVKPDPFYEKIYVSRAATTHRHLPNEGEICSLLSEQGFVPIHCDAYTVAQQARIFSSANVVIAPHGAALTNLMFCRPGTKVIELFSPNWLRHTYWVISERCQLEYHRLIGKKTETAELSDYQKIADDIQIEWDDLRSVMKQAGVL